ncbi:MAG: response regulator [Alphaproteobacteria bacterium]|nr:response regulator [Alphaproteobacteria bacterium]
MASILIAEDDKAVREFVSRALRQDGHDIMAVSDGQQALNALGSRRFDMLLADIVMPHVDGIALALKASKDYPDLPVLLMTGYAAERQRAHNLETLIHEVISKPFTLRDICESVRRVLAEPPAGQQVH